VTPERPDKKRKVISPLSKSSEICPTITPKHLKDMGNPFPNCPGVLSIYEGIANAEEALQQARKFSTKLSGERDRLEIWAERKDEEKRDLFIFQTPKDRSPEPIEALFAEVSQRLSPEVLSTGMVQLLELPGDVMLIILFKTKIIRKFF